MKILNLHGFMGSSDNKNYKALCEIVSENIIVSPELDFKENSPKNILQRLYAMVYSNDFIFVGQSLGGWYANKLSLKFNRPCVLTNPCYFPHKCDVIIDSGISSEYLYQYENYSETVFNPNAFTLCSDNDTIITNNYDNCIKFSASVTTVHGGHSTIENLSENLSKVILYDRSIL